MACTNDPHTQAKINDLLPHARRIGFPVRHFVRDYTYNSKTKGRASYTTRCMSFQLIVYAILLELL